MMHGLNDEEKDSQRYDRWYRKCFKSVNKRKNEN